LSDRSSHTQRSTPAESSRTRGPDGGQHFHSTDAGIQTTGGSRGRPCAFRGRRPLTRAPLRRRELSGARPHGRGPWQRCAKRRAADAAPRAATPGVDATADGHDDERRKTQQTPGKVGGAEDRGPPPAAGRGSPFVVLRRGPHIRMSPARGRGHRPTIAHQKQSPNSVTPPPLSYARERVKSGFAARGPVPRSRTRDGSPTPRPT
jgi:hypothetical protein